MFVSYVTQDAEGNEVDTLGILINKTDSDTRGSVLVIQPNGVMTTHHNIPLDGNQVENGVHIKLRPPENLSPELPPQNGGEYTYGSDS